MNLTPVILIWLISALFGLYFAVNNLRASLQDREEASLTDDELRAARMVVTNGYVFRNWMRTAIFAWWTVLGVGFGFFDLSDVPRLGGALGLVATAIGWTVIGAQESTERRRISTLAAKAARILTAKSDADLQNALERTAESTERIADNTDKLMGSQEEDAK